MLISRVRDRDQRRERIAFIHTVRIWRSPSQTFASISGLLLEPAPSALRLAGLRALPMIPGVRIRPGSDWLGRHGRVYALGDQSIVINPATGGVLGFSNPTLTEAFTQNHLAPRCVAYGSFLRPVSRPRWCFVLPKGALPSRAAATAAAAAARTLAQRASIARK